MKVEKLEFPFQHEGISYFYHINNLFYGESEQGVRRLFEAYHFLMNCDSPSGRFVAKSLSTHAKSGQVLLLAIDRPYIVDDIAAQWRPLKNNISLSNKIYTGSSIAISIGQRGVLELACSLGHEGTHHVVAYINQAIRPGAYNTDPSLYSDILKGKIIKAYNLDLKNINKIPDPELREFAQIFFNKPGAYVEQRLALLRHLKCDSKLLEHLHLTMDNPKLFRSELVACLVEAEIACPGFLKNIAPKTSQVLFHSFQVNRIQNLFPIEIRGVTPPQKLTAPRRVPQEGLALLYDNAKYRSRTHFSFAGSYPCDKSNLRFDTIKPKPLFESPLDGQLNIAHLRRQLWNSEHPYDHFMYKWLDRKLPMWPIDGDELLHKTFWLNRKVAPSHLEGPTRVFKNIHQRSPLFNQERFASSAVEEFNINGRLAAKKQLGGLGVKGPLKMNNHTLLGFASGYGLNMTWNFFQNPNPNWIMESSVRFCVDNIVYAPIDYALGSLAMPVYLLGAMENRLEQNISNFQHDIEFLLQEPASAYRNYQLHHRLEALGNAYVFHAASKGINDYIFPPFYITSDYLCSAILNGVEAVGDGFNAQENWIAEERANPSCNEDRQELLDDLQIANAPWQAFCNLFNKEPAVTAPVDIDGAAPHQQKPSFVTPVRDYQFTTHHSRNYFEAIDNDCSDPGTPEKKEQQADRFRLPEFQLNFPKAQNEGDSELCDFKIFIPAADILNTPNSPNPDENQGDNENKMQIDVTYVSDKYQDEYISNLMKSKEEKKFEIESITLGPPLDNGIGIAINANMTGGSVVSASIAWKVGNELVLRLSIQLTLTTELLAASIVGAIFVAGAMFIYENYWKHKQERTLRHIKRHFESSKEDLKEFNEFIKTVPELLGELQFDPKNIQQYIKELEEIENKIIEKLAEYDTPHRIKYAYKHKNFGAYRLQIQIQQEMRLGLLNAREAIKFLKRHQIAHAKYLEQYSDSDLKTLIERAKLLKEKKILTEKEFSELATIRDLIISKAPNIGWLINNHGFLFDGYLGTYYKFEPVELNVPIDPNALDNDIHDRKKKCPQYYKRVQNLKRLYNKFRRAVERAENQETIRKAKDEFLAELGEVKKILKGVDCKAKNAEGEHLTLWDHHAVELDTMERNVTTVWQHIIDPTKLKKPPLIKTPSQFDTTLMRRAHEFESKHTHCSPEELLKLGRRLVSQEKIAPFQKQGYERLVTNKIAEFLISNDFTGAREFLAENEKLRDHKKSPLSHSNKKELKKQIDYFENIADYDLKGLLSEYGQKSTDQSAKLTCIILGAKIRNITLDNIVGLSPSKFLEYLNLNFKDASAIPESALELLKSFTTNVIRFLVCSNQNANEYLTQVPTNIINPEFKGQLEARIKSYQENKSQNMDYFLQLLEASKAQEEQDPLSTENNHEKNILQSSDHEFAKWGIGDVTRKSIATMTPAQLGAHAKEVNGNNKYIDEAKKLIHSEVEDKLFGMIFVEKDKKNAETMLSDFQAESGNYLSSADEERIKTWISYFDTNKNQNAEFWKEEWKKNIQNNENKEKEEGDKANSIAKKIDDSAHGQSAKNFCNCLLQEYRSMSPDDLIKRAKEVAKDNVEEAVIRKSELAVITRLLEQHVKILIHTDPEAAKKVYTDGVIKVENTDTKEEESYVFTAAFSQAACNIIDILVKAKQGGIPALLEELGKPTDIKLDGLTDAEKEKVQELHRDENIRMILLECRERIKLGFYGEGAHYFDQLNQKLTNAEQTDYELASEIKLNLFKHVTQCMDPIVASLFALIEHQVESWELSKIREAVQKTLNVIRTSQQFVPNVVTLSLQGLFSLLRGDVHPWIKQVRQIPEQYFNNLFGSPASVTGKRDFGIANIIAWMQLESTIINHLPKSADKLIEGFLPINMAEGRRVWGLVVPQVIKHLDLANTTWDLFKTGSYIDISQLNWSKFFLNLVKNPGSAYFGLNLAKVANYAFDLAFFLNGNESENRKNGHAIVDPSKLLVREGVKMLITNLGNLIHMIAITLVTGPLLGVFLASIKIIVDLVSLGKGIRWRSQRDALANAIHNIQVHSDSVNKLTIEMSKIVQEMNKLIQEKKEPKANIPINQPKKEQEFGKKLQALQQQQLPYKLEVTNYTNQLARLLNKHFGGLRYRVNTDSTVNEARIVHLYQKVKHHYECKEYSQVLALSQQNIDVRQKLKRINTTYKIPAHLAWLIIYLRLNVYANVSEYVKDFAKEYNNNLGYIRSSAPTEWWDQYKDTLKKTFRKVVKTALQSYAIHALYAPANEQQEYFNKITGEYSLFSWQNLLNNDYKLQLAVLTFQYNQTDYARTYFETIDLTRLKKDKLPVGSLLLFHAMRTNNAACGSFFESVLAAFTEEKFNIEVDYLCQFGRYREILTLVDLVNSRYSRRSYAQAIATYSLSQQTEFGPALQLLVKQQKRDLPYLQLLLDLIQQARGCIFFIADQQRKLRCYVMLLAFSRIVSEALKNEYINNKLEMPPELEKALGLVIASANEGLKDFFTKSNQKTNPMLEAQNVVDQFVASVAHNITRQEDLAVKIEQLLSDMSFHGIPNSTAQFLPFVPREEKDSLFAIFGMKKVEGIQKLLDYLRAQNIRLDLQTILEVYRTSENMTASIREAVVTAFSLYHQKNIRIWVADVNNELRQEFITQQANFQESIDILVHHPKSTPQQNPAEDKYAKLTVINVPRTQQKTVEINRFIFNKIELQCRKYCEKQDKTASEPIKPAIAKQVPEDKVQCERAEVLYALASDNLDKDDNSLAFTLLQQTLVLNPKHANAHYQLSLLYKQRFGREAYQKRCHHLLEAAKAEPAKRKILEDESADTEFAWGQFERQGYGIEHWQNQAEHRDNVLYVKLENKIIKYRVTDPCGYRQEGEIFEAGLEIELQSALAANNLAVLLPKLLTILIKRQHVRDPELGIQCYQRAAAKGHHYAKIEKLKIEQAPLSLKDLEQLGINYFFDDKCEQLDKAHACFEAIIERQPNHPVALYYLGMIMSLPNYPAEDRLRGEQYLRLAELHGHCDAKRAFIYKLPTNYSAEQFFALGETYNAKETANYDVFKAKLCYQRASDRGHLKAKIRLYQITKPDYVATDWYNEGCKEQVVNAELAKVYYQVALDLDARHINALHALATLHEQGLGTQKDLKQAKDLYANAHAAGHPNANEKCQVLNLLLETSNFTADRLSELGDDYYYERNGKTKNFLLAKTCYEEAKNKNNQHARAVFGLGQLYASGQGVLKNPAVAKQYYEQAAAEKHYKATAALLEMNNPTLNTAQAWHDLGESYYLGEYEGKRQTINNVFARACYKKAIKIEAHHIHSHYRLAQIFDHGGYGVVPNLSKSNRYLQRIANQNVAYVRDYHTQIQLRLDYPGITTTEQWWQKAEEYYRANDRSLHFGKAYACYKMVTLSPNSMYSHAYFILGYMHAYGEGRPKDINEAITYFLRSFATNDNNSSLAENELLKVIIDPYNTAKGWYELGDDYYVARNGKTKDYQLARACYQMAIKKDTAKSYIYNWSYDRLGDFYKLGLGVAVDLVETKRKYQLAANENYYPAIKALLLIEHASFNSAQQWRVLAEAYYFNKPSDYIKARACYERAIEIDKNDHRSLYVLGWIYSHGQETTKDLAQGITCYLRSYLLGNNDAKQGLLQLQEQPFNTAKGWFELGEDYCFEKNSKKQDFELARACYELAITKDTPKTHIYSWSYRRLGEFYQKGLGVTVDLEQAKQKYQLAATENYYVAIKDLVALLHSALTTAEQWYALGETYYRGNERAGDKYRARACYDIATSKTGDQGQAYYSLGWMQAQGEGGFEKDLAQARRTYLRAAELKNYNAKEQLLLLDHPNVKSRIRWYEIGAGYFHGKDHTPVDYQYARACYEQAYKYPVPVTPVCPNLRNNLLGLYDHVEAQKFIDVKSDYELELSYFDQVNHQLGYIYHHGHEVAVDTNKAREYYELSEQRFFDSHKQLLLLLWGSQLTTADQWCNFADVYFYGKNTKVNYRTARAAYEIAIDKTYYHGRSLCMLGWLEAEGKEVEKNLYFATNYYCRAIVAGYHDAQTWLNKILDAGPKTHDYFSSAAATFENHGDYVNAAKYYQLALQRGYDSGEFYLDRLLKNSKLTGDNLNAIGILYYQGKDGVKKDYALAARWFEQAEAKVCAAAMCNRGILFEDGLHYQKSFLKAAIAYWRAKIRGSELAITYSDKLLTRTDISGEDCYTIAYTFLDDSHYFPNFDQAIKWLQKAKEKQFQPSFEILANLQEVITIRDRGRQNEVARNFVQAAKLYQQALDRGYEPAELNLIALKQRQDLEGNDLYYIGAVYHNGDGGVEIDYEEAATWFALAIAKNNAAAYQAVGLLYEYGGHYQQNFIIAAKHYQQAIERGYVEAQTDLDHIFNRADISGEQLYCIGFMYIEGHTQPTAANPVQLEVQVNPSKAARWLEKAKVNNYPDAFRKLGEMYANGRHYPQNFLEAARLFKPHHRQEITLLCQRNDITLEILDSMAVMFSAGVHCDLELAAVCQRAASDKRGQAAFTIRQRGFNYEQGTGQYPRNFVEAAKHYQQAIDQGYAQGEEDLARLFLRKDIHKNDLYAIGLFYHEGKDVKQNYEKAAKWYELARAKDHAGAYYKLGVLHENGLFYKQNAVTAAKFYQHGIYNGFKEAQEDLERLLNNPKMGGEQLFEIGNLYCNQQLKLDYSIASKWLEKAKAKNFPDAYRKLGQFFAEGYHYKQDFLEAARHFYPYHCQEVNSLFSHRAITAEILDLMAGMFLIGDGVPRDDKMVAMCRAAAEIKRSAASAKPHQVKPLKVATTMQGPVQKPVARAVIHAGTKTANNDMPLQPVVTQPTPVIHPVKKSAYSTELTFFSGNRKKGSREDRWYSDADIETVLNLKIDHLGGRKQQCKYLLKGENGYFSENNTNYTVLVADAILSTTRVGAVPINYFIDKDNQSDHSYIALFRILIPRLESLRSLPENDCRRAIHEAIRPEISSSDRGEAANAVYDVLRRLQFDQRQIENEIIQLNNLQKHDIFDEIKLQILSSPNMNIKILFPYNVRENHWLTCEIKIHKIVNRYAILITPHDPFGGGEIDNDNYTKLIQSLQKRIREIDNTAIMTCSFEKSIYQRRQHDHDSCGAIMLEDLVQRIRGLHLSTTYESGASALREGHIKMVEDRLPIDNPDRREFILRHPRIYGQEDVSVNPSYF